ncbi:GPP34 family phosphoprotein [Kitasatospora sp. NPDC006697]|uniref:GOLPH3/VPS74 family protein n=1 Tax=Kitasatospora sp. NPDC006697 TaxID=3364020 RepID=UPI003684CAE7
MNLARGVALVAFDGRSGALRGGERLDLALAGAELVSLARAERIAVQRGRVIILDETPVGSTQLDVALATLRPFSEPHLLSPWLHRRALGLRGRYLGDLHEAGEVEPRGRRRFGLFGDRRSQLTATSSRRDLLLQLDSDAPADPTFAALVHLAAITRKDLRRRLAATVGNLDAEGGDRITGAAKAERVALFATRDAARRVREPQSSSDYPLDPDVQRAWDLGRSVDNGL